VTNDSAPSYAQAVDAAKAEALEAGVANVLHLQVHLSRHLSRQRGSCVWANCADTQVRPHSIHGGVITREFHCWIPFMGTRVAWMWLWMSTWICRHATGPVHLLQRRVPAC
jgi:hypothetical protein